MEPGNSHVEFETVHSVLTRYKRLVEEKRLT
jgi:hypothetical protein